MGKIIALILIAAAGWFVYTGVDFSKVKDSSVEALKKEKTINAINSRRDTEQSDVNNVINGNIR